MITELADGLSLWGGSGSFLKAGPGPSCPLNSLRDQQQSPRKQRAATDLNLTPAADPSPDSRHKGSDCWFQVQSRTLMKRAKGCDVQGQTAAGGLVQRGGEGLPR